MEEFKPSSCLERKISSKERRRGRRAAAAAKQFNYASVVKSVDSSKNVNIKSESKIQNMKLVSTETVVLETNPADENNNECVKLCQTESSSLSKERNVIVV